MSSPAPRTIHTSGTAMSGNTARALNADTVPGHDPDIDIGLRPERRTPLSVVPVAPRKRRAPFAIFCFAVLGLALVAVLVVNVSLSSGQYRLIELTRQQTQLQQDNQRLTQEVNDFRAPQNLAARAANLGMVDAKNHGAINVSTLEVSGDTEPAQKQDEPEALIPAPAVPGQSTEEWLDAPDASHTGDRDKSDKPEKSDKASDKKSDQTSDKASDKKSDQKSDKASDKTSDKASDKASGEQAPQAGAQQLHGGTIEAPQQMSPAAP